MLFWAPSGRALMVTDEQRACTHYEGLVRHLHPAGPRSLVRAPDPLPATQRHPSRQVLVLASSCLSTGLRCRFIEMGSWLHGLGLKQCEGAFRNDEIDHASCSPRVSRTWRNIGEPMSCEFGGP